MNFLSVDYGEKKCGLAISEGNFVSPLTVVDTKEAFTRIVEIIHRENIQTCVLGLPDGRLKEEVYGFGEKLKSKIKASVVFWDETLTTHAAKHALVAFSTSKKRKKEKEHAFSAAFILETYLEHHKI